MQRRQFMKYAAAGAGAVAGSPLLTGPASAVIGPPEREYSGSDLSEWEEALGDALWVAAGQDQVTASDIRSRHNGGSSTLRANVKRRGVMAHNINFRRIIDDDAFDYVHAGSYEFKLPYLPEPGSWPDNAQTLEGGFFIWDGGGTRLDHGLAFQWILNPWMSTFGDLLCWTPANGGSWAPAGHLEPDTEWHTFAFTLDVGNQATAMTMDGEEILSSFVAMEKPANWGTETASRLQAEIVSLWPGDNPDAPSHRAKFRNWTWQWHPQA